MARTAALYEVDDAATGDTLSRHRTRQAAIDSWRTQLPGRAVRMYRIEMTNGRTLIVEGTWHESHRL